MNNEHWKSNLLKYILSIGSVTLVGFTFVYMYEGNKVMALGEGFVALCMLFSIFWIKPDKYLGPAVVGWSGVFWVLVTLLFTGGIAGAGVVWWGLMPIISFMLFGLTGGVYATVVVIFTLISASVLSQYGVFHFYFSPDAIRQTAVVVTVLGFIMYYFEKISSSARDEVMVKSDLLENLTKDLETNVRELQGEKSGQENTRKAIMNILEDTIDLDKELKIEKQSIERKVVERTAELKKANNEVNKGWFQIREEKAKLVASINSIVRAYVLVGLDGKIELVNNRMSEFFGEVEGNWTLDMIQEKVGSKFDILQLYNKAKNEHQKTEVKEIEIAGKYYDVHVSPIFLSPEKLIGVLLMFGDITEQKIIDRSKDEFFSIASHELRTPLTAIRGNSSLIKDLYLEKIKDQDLVEMINDIHESSVRLIGIVNDFLNVSRLEMGKMQFKKEPFDINSLVQKTIDEIDDKNDQVKIQTTKGKTDIINVVGDSDRAKEVLINIIGNAVKFSEKGVVTVDFKVDSKEVTILVTDSGRGIAPENQNLLFHKFQQAGDNLLTRDTTKSTGLGLYISKLMAEGMGGKIWLEKSELGRGSTFAFSLPTAI